MSMKFHTLPESKIINLDLLQATEALSTLKDEMERNFGKLEHADQILGNIQDAVEALNKYGDIDTAVIAIYNVDRSLEALTQTQLKDITKDAALEALDDKQKSGWEKFKDAVKEVIAKIVAFIRALFTSTNQKIEYLKNLTQWTPSDKQYTIVTKENAKTLDLMSQEINDYVNWLQIKAHSVKDNVNVGTVANEADVKLEEILKRYSNFLSKKEGEQFPMFKLVADEALLVNSTLGDAGYTDINRVKVFLNDINSYIMNVVQRGVIPVSTRLENSIAGLVQWIGSKSSDPTVVEVSKLIRNLEVSSMECLRIMAKISSVFVRTITAIYTDAHAAEPNAAPAA